MAINFLLMLFQLLSLRNDLLLPFLSFLLTHFEFLLHLRQLSSHPQYLLFQSLTLFISLFQPDTLLLVLDYRVLNYLLLPPRLPPLNLPLQLLVVNRQYLIIPRQVPKQLLVWFITTTTLHTHTLPDATPRSAATLFGLLLQVYWLLGGAILF